MIPAGTVITVFSLMMVSLTEKNQPYQVFLSHGVLFGFGIALLYVYAPLIVLAVLLIVAYLG